MVDGFCLLGLTINCKGTSNQEICQRQCFVGQQWRSWKRCSDAMTCLYTYKDQNCAINCFFCDTLWKWKLDFEEANKHFWKLVLDSWEYLRWSRKQMDHSNQLRFLIQHPNDQDQLITFWTYNIIPKTKISWQVHNVGKVGGGRQKDLATGWKTTAVKICTIGRLQK